MAIVYLLAWWYRAGLLQEVRRVGGRLAGLFDFFSLDILIKTFFAPFRQISSGRVRGGLNVQWRAFVDRLISRLVGATVRFFTIIAGLVSLIGAVLIHSLWLLAWIILPFVPIIGLIAALAGWVPWSL